MDTALSLLALRDSDLAEIPLGFRTIYFKKIPEGFSRDCNFYNEKFGCLEVSAAQCEKPISKIDLAEA